MNAYRPTAFVTSSLCAFVMAMAAVAPATTVAAPVQGSGSAATENRALPDFQAVGLSGSMDLVVRQGAQQSVQVQADANLLSSLETVVESGAQGPTLQIRWKKGESLYPKVPVRITVVVPRLRALAVAGSGEVRVEAFDTPSLQLSVSGSGDARLDALKTEELGVRLSGSGDVSGSGTARKLQVRVAGSGDVGFASMRADDVLVSIAGSGNVAVDAQKTLTVSIAGSGDVNYSGNPSVKSSVAGSGSVTKK